VTSGSTPAAADFVDAVYASIITAGTHRASSIKVAEAAKVIENTQRDINIALMNELSMIFDRMGIRTADVLAAAGTKWNFLKFRPGLVGGHCIGVDPYYLTTKAQQLGYQPEVILAGRRVNDNMGRYIAQRLVKLLVNADRPVRGARVGVLGLTFKENVTDIRNSKVPDIIRELTEFGIHAIVHDPIASPQETLHEYGVELSQWAELRDLDALVVAVAHDEYVAMGDDVFATLRDGGILVDVKSIFTPAKVDARLRYWSL
jgi:UDP-N-acetyl-D-galactosamine dehydrogenase